MLRQAFADHHGHEIDTAGDGFFVVFERAGDAVSAAVDAQRALAERHRADQVALRVRMGLHTAEPYLDDDGYTGVGVHRAARICGVGHGGQILLSNATAGVVEDLELDGMALRDLGEHRLKDLILPQRLFQLDVEGLSAEFPPLAAADGRGGIATLVAVDLAGWNQVMRTLGDDASALAASRFHTLASKSAAAHGGRVLEAIADTVIAAFGQPADGIRAAMTLRTSLRTEPWIVDDHRCVPRSAVHTGRLPAGGGQQLGTTALYVTKLCEEAEEGQILVSHSTEALLEGSLRSFELDDLGERTVSGWQRPERVFAVSG